MVKGWFTRAGEAWERFVSYVGGERGSRNLLGVILDLLGGLVKLPFILIGGTWKFLVFLFKEPKKAGDYLLFLGSRMRDTFFAFVGFRIKPTIRFKEHAATLLYLWLFSSMLAPIAFQIWNPLGWAMLVGPGAVWLLSGIRPAFEAWRQYGYEDWLQETARVKAQARVDAARDRMARQDDLADLMADLEALEQINPELIKDIYEKAPRLMEAFKKYDENAKRARSEATTPEPELEKGGDMPALEGEQK